jgi:hypothetical protein
MTGVFRLRMLLWVILVIAVVVLFLIGLLFWGIKHAILLALNSLVGYFALYAIQAWQVLPTLVINAWSVLLTAIFGIIGFLFVIILHVLHIAF